MIWLGGREVKTLEPRCRCSLTPTLCACLLGFVLISTGECEYYRVSHKIVDTWVIAILSGKTHPVLKYSGNMLHDLEIVQYSAKPIVDLERKKSSITIFPL